MPSCWLKHSHPSKSERDDCNHLRMRELAGEIKSFSLYPSIKLYVKCGEVARLWKIWKADFKVIELDGSFSIHESKGWNRSNDSFKLKAHAFLKQHPNIPLYVNRVLIPPDSKRFSIPGVMTQKKKPAWKSWDRKLKRYVYIDQTKAGKR